MNEQTKQALIPGAIIIAGLIIAGAIIYTNQGATPPGELTGNGGTVQPSEGVEPPGNGQPVDVSIDDDPMKGDLDAPVTIIEFSEFQCPFCGRYFNEAYQQIEDEYIKTGKVKYVFRDFPLPFHENAQKAAEAAECADEQEKFWEMHDKMFENQSLLTVSDLKKYAADLGLNTNQFNTCLDSGKYEDEIKKDLADGQAAGVGGTPSFFINGELLVGAQPFSAFKAVIDSKLE